MLVQSAYAIFRIRKDETDQTFRGYDRVSVPDSFLVLMQNYVLLHWSGQTAPSKSPTGTKQSWTEIMTSHFQNIRIKYYDYLGRKAASQREWIRIRFEDHVAFHTEHYVSYLTVQ